MSEKLFARRPVYPMIGLAATLINFMYALITVKSANCIWFIAGVYILLLAYGYWRACLAVLPFAAVMAVVFCGVTYLVTRDPHETLFALNRILAISVAIVPGLGLSPEALVRNFTKLKVPRLVTLGMMITLSFFPLLFTEVQRVREAMETRGAGSSLQPKVFYRAFLIPLLMRIVNISDTLALSVETRGFDPEAPCSVYKTIRITPRDILFLLLIVAGAVLAVIL